MKAKVVALVGFVGAALAVLPTAAYASCSVAAEHSGPVVRAVEEELARLAPLKPGSDARDAAWLKDNLVEIVPDWLPATKSLAEEAESDLERLVDECYRPGDYAVAGPVRFEFIACAKKGALTQVAPSRLADWNAVCGELSTSFQDPSTVERVREWTRQWVDSYIQHTQTRGAA